MGVRGVGRNLCHQNAENKISVASLDFLNLFTLYLFSEPLCFPLDDPIFPFFL